MWTQLWISINTKMAEIVLQDLRASETPYKFLKEWKMEDANKDCNSLLAEFSTASRRMNSISTNCKSSSTFGILSKVLLRYVKALWWLIAINAAKAFLLHVVSLSPARKFSINSGASGMRLSAIKSHQRSV